MKHSLIPKFFLVVLFLSALAGDAAAAEEWLTLTNCILVSNEANDGDSFHVRAAGKEYIFRLYFIDTPETDASLPYRVAEQAKYFQVTVPQTLQIGLEAEKFTRRRLGRPFTVHTRLQDARGRSQLPRYFAFVEMGKGDLAEDLIANGLARVYGATAPTPAGKTPETEKEKLEQLERTARAQKIGGWGVGAGRLNHRAPTPSSGAASSGGTSSFHAFFHPEATATPVATAPGAPVTAAPFGAKLDVNTASSEALQRLPGIGPVLAAHIIAARPFKSADELERVPGIGEKKYALLRPYFQ